MPSPSSPIGVFDSGIGGLSVLHALRQALPNERFIYLADSGHAPYGERGDAFVQQRSATIVQWMRSQHNIKALVLACNTATAAAVDGLRCAHPGLPIIGVEPALKPAALRSATHTVGVIATQGTVSSARFIALQARQSASTRFVVQACAGLAQAIEDSTRPEVPAVQSDAKIKALCAYYTGAMGPFGLGKGEMDTLVLGCTHYVFAAPILQELLGPKVQLIDTGAPVAKRCHSVLQATGMLATNAMVADCQCQLFTTGERAALTHAAQQWLGLPATCCHGCDSLAPSALKK